MRTALVLGATGLIGGHLLRLLAAQPEYGRVVALVRRPTGLRHPKLAERIVDYERLAEARDALAVDDLFCCLGTTIKKAGSQAAFRRVDYDYPMAAARLAKEAGVKRFLLVSSMGADPRAAVFYSRVKGELERDLAALDLPALLIFRPSLLLGERQEVRMGESIAAAIMRALDPLLKVGPLARVRAIEGRTVARAMVRAALQGPAGVQVYLNDAIQRMGE